MIYVQVLKELEPSVNDVFAQTKTWRSYHEREMKLWDKLHIAVKKNALAEYQYNKGFLPDTAEASPTWYVDHTHIGPSVLPCVCTGLVWQWLRLQQADM